MGTPHSEQHQDERSERPSLLTLFAFLPLLLTPSLKAAGLKSVLAVDVTAVSVAVLLFMAALAFVKKPAYPLKPLVPLLFFSIIALFELWRHSNTLYAFQDDEKVTGSVISCVAVATLPVLCRTRSGLAALNLAWLIAGTATGALIVIVGGAATLWGRGGINDAYLGPAYLAGIGLVLSVAAILNRSIHLFLALSGALVCGVGLMATGSRGPIIAFGMALLVLLALSSSHRRWVWGLAVTATVLVVGVSLASQASVLNLASQDYVRPRLWELAWGGFLSSPIYGQGWGSFASSSMEHGYYAITYPHNVALELLSEYGILGLIAFAWVLLSSLRRVISNRASTEVTTAGVVMTYWLASHLFSFDLSDRQMWIALAPCLMVSIMGIDNVRRDIRSVDTCALSPKPKARHVQATP